jgi:hypothetical protein
MMIQKSKNRLFRLLKRTFITQRLSKEDNCLLTCQWTS